MKSINKRLIAHLSAIILSLSLITGQVIPALAADGAEEETAVVLTSSEDPAVEGSAYGTAAEEDENITDEDDSTAEESSEEETDISEESSDEDDAIFVEEDAEVPDITAELTADVTEKVAVKEVTDTAAVLLGSAEDKTYSIDISLSQANEDGDKLEASISISDEDGNTPDVEESDYYVELFASYGSSSNSTGKKKLSGTDGTIILSRTVRAGKSHDVYAVLYDEDKDKIAESSHTQIEAVKLSLSKDSISVNPSWDGSATGSITIDGDYNDIRYYREGGSPSGSAAEGVISGLEKGTYYVYIPAYTDENTFYLLSNKQKVVVDANAPATYTIKTSGNEHVKWTKSETELTQGRTTSIYVHSTDEDRYYISNVYASPADAAAIKWNSSTGEVFISSISDNVTLVAETVEKAVPSKITVEEVSFNRNGIYSEENPYIQTELKVKVTDQFGKAVVKSKVYFKDDVSEVSYVQTRETEEDGTAVFKYSFGINVENGDTTAHYVPQFALDSGFTELLASTDVYLVLQLKKDLVLYEDQITGTYPEDNAGKVTGVPDDYELWSGDVHQGALVTGDGAHWISPVNGEFTGLRSGQQALRIGEKVDGNTFYFASDYDYFFVPRLVNREETTEEEESTEETGEEKETESVEESTEEPEPDPVRPKKRKTVLPSDDTTSDTSDTSDDNDDYPAAYQNNKETEPVSYIPATLRFPTTGTVRSSAAEAAVPADTDLITDNTAEKTVPSITEDTDIKEVAIEKSIEDNAVPLAGSIEQTPANSPDAIFLYSGLLILLVAAGIYGFYRYNKRKEAE